MEGAALSYFSSLSNLSRRIFDECQEIENGYGHEWCNLPVEEQDMLLDQHFIDYDLLCKYAPEPSCVELITGSFPILNVVSGEKVVVDFEHCENGWTWRDEHSGPFSWRTKSQLDLTLESMGHKEDISLKKKNCHRVPIHENVAIESDYATKNEVEEMFKKFGLRKFEGENRTNKKDICPENLGFEYDTESKVERSIPIQCDQIENEKFKLLSDESLKKKTKNSSKSSRKTSLSANRKRSSELCETLGEDGKDMGNYNEVFQEPNDIAELSLEEFLSRPLESTNALDQDFSRENNIPLKKTGLDFLDNW